MTKIFYYKSLISKLVLSLVAVYIGVSYGFFAFNVRDYDYRRENFIHLNATILMQPLMDIFADGKVSHWYDWQKFENSQLNPDVTNLILRSKSPVYVEHDKKISFKNTLRSLGAVKEAALVEPYDFNGQWSLVSCDLKEVECEVSNILAKGRIKILVDGDTKLWGLDRNNNLIQLSLIRYIDRSENKEILFI